MKQILLLLSLVALTAPLRAQTNTNSFVVTPTAAVTIQPAITANTLTVQRVTMDFQHQFMAVWFVGVAKPCLIKGAAFTALTTPLQTKLGAGMATYLQANPPRP